MGVGERGAPLQKKMLYRDNYERTNEFELAFCRRYEYVVLFLVVLKLFLDLPVVGYVHPANTSLILKKSAQERTLYTCSIQFMILQITYCSLLGLGS